jgi:hypothetical protein
MISLIKKNFNYLVILALVVIIIMQRSCSRAPKNTKEIIKIAGKKYEVVKRETDTIRVEVAHNVYKKGQDIYHEVPVYIDVPENVDTAAILKNYYTLNVYKDTLKLKDSLGYIAVTDSISKNILLGRTWDAKINKTVIDNKIYLKASPKVQVYVGGSLGLQKPSNFRSCFNHIGGNLLLKTKSDEMIGIGVGVNSQLNTYFQGTYLWKISFKN